MFLKNIGRFQKFLVTFFKNNGMFLKAVRLFCNYQIVNLFSGATYIGSSGVMWKASYQAWT